MAKKQIREPTHRTWEDPVTHEVKRVELTPERLAFERVVAAMDRELIKLGAADGDRMLDLVVEVIKLKRRHTG